jgi:hypothetical protein
VREAWRSRPIVGRVDATIRLSSTIMKRAAPVTAMTAVGEEGRRGIIVRQRSY